MTTSEMRLEALLGNSIEFSKHLRYLDLSGQPISLNFQLIESSLLETLILNDCQKIDTCCCTAILKQLRNLRILSLPIKWQQLLPLYAYWMFCAWLVQALRGKT